MAIYSQKTSSARKSCASTRSEIYTTKPPRLLSTSTSFESNPEDFTAGTTPALTVKGTVHPLHSQFSGGSSARARSIALISGHHTEKFGEQPDIDNKYATQSIQLTTPSEYSETPNHLATRSQESSTQLMKRLDEVASLQKDISARRIHARDLRSVLRQSRGKEEQMRQALRSTLDLIGSQEIEIHTQCVPLAANNTILKLQEAMISYQTMEKRYNDIEDRLGKEEYHLDQRLAQISRSMNKAVILMAQQEQRSGTTSGSDSNYASSVHHAPHEDTKKALHAQADYDALIENANMVRERLEDLELTHLSLIEQQRFNEPECLALDNSAELFLDKYEDEKDDLEEELNAALVEIELHSDPGKPYETAVSDEEWRDMLEEYLPDPPEEQPPPDLLRASPLEDRSPFFETARPMPWNKSNFVNHWLLYRLRHSAVEILNFKNQPELLDLLEQGCDRDSISEMAMSLWFEDGVSGMENLKSNSGV